MKTKPQRFSEANNEVRKSAFIIIALMCAAGRDDEVHKQTIKQTDKQTAAAADER